MRGVLETQLAEFPGVAQKREPLKGIVLKKCWPPASRPACRA
jgi:hypothetical protein